MNNNRNASPLRIGILGSGWRGRTLAAALRDSGEHARIVACCDTSPATLERNRADFGADIFTTSDHHELLGAGRIDAVIVSSPDFLHAEHAVAALEAGVHVFLEKPMATTIEDCDRILRAAARSRGRLYVGHNMRFFPVMQKMRALIEAGRIGRVEAIWCRHFISYGGDAYFKDWHSERKHTTGLLLQKGAHDIDIIHWLGGAPTVRAVGMGKLSVYNEVPSRRHLNEPGEPAFNPDNWPPLAQTGLSPVIDVEDHGMVLLQLANGVQASYQQCHYTPDDGRNYTVIGTEGRIENIGDHSTAERTAEVHLWNRRAGADGRRGNEVFPIPHTPGSHGGADPLMMADFIRYIRTGERSGAGPADARAAVAAGVLATQSLRGGSTPFEVPPVG